MPLCSDFWGYISKPAKSVLFFSREKRNFHLRRFGLTVLCGLALSLFCETMQGLFMLGTAETDDLLMNTAGVALGAVSALAAGVLSLPIRWLRKSGETSRK